jgi:hypothetical protein
MKEHAISQIKEYLIRQGEKNPDDQSKSYPVNQDIESLVN